MGSEKGTIELSLRHLKDLDFGKIPKKQNAAITALAAPHVESFNFFLEEGIRAVLNNLPPVEFSVLDKHRISLRLADVLIAKPKVPPPIENVLDLNMYPKECTERGTTYSAMASASIEWTLDGVKMMSIRQSLGQIPIMVMSKNCNLHKMTPKELVKHGEIVNETGGYFIINGAARIIRLLSANRRNYPVAMSRESWRKRSDFFSDKGVLIRCVREDETSSMNILHYLNTGEAKLEFVQLKQAFLVPLVMALRVLLDFSDQQIFAHLIRGREKDIYFSEKIKTMMRALQKEGLYTQDMCKAYVGKAFRHRVGYILPDWYTDQEVCDFLFDQYVLIHLKTPVDKFNTLCLMARKLYSYIAGESKHESVDTVSMQEVSLGGHTYLQLFREKLMDTLTTIKILLLVKAKKEGDNFKVTDNDIMKFSKRGTHVGTVFKTFLATGTLVSKSGCGLMQTNGLTVVMEHLNRMRDLSHLRAFHRGSFFVDMKTIEPRRLTGEAWGFVCPVHTPDGAPCGLLNHLAESCEVVTSSPDDPRVLLRILATLGMTPPNTTPLAPYADCLEVVVDGCFVGYIRNDESKAYVHKLRIMKATGELFKYTEIVLVPRRKHGGQYPGLFIATSMSRLMRPVINLSTQTIEYLGTMEQLYLNIAVSPEEIEEGVHSHLEVSKTAILSNIGKLVPFSDCNPNPRNMYQCQMGKQTMGTPFHNWKNQTTGKVYRLQYPQVPLVRNAHYDKMNMEEFCMGFNAVIAIISYTGYDMEDAMILNKCSMERGLAHGQIYKTEFVDLSQLLGKKTVREVMYVFRRNPDEENQKNFLDSNGLPYPGTRLEQGDPYYCIYNFHQRKYKRTDYKGEPCVVDKYTIMSSGVGSGECQRVAISLRVQRNPIIGDKFASRSGQKGIMSRLYPVEDLPFSERGIMPDIIFNPHGIPSRMTAGKLIELVSGKCAAEFGKSFDSTPFQFSEENPAVDYFGKILEKAGFNYYGEDVLYSGTDGRMLDVHIFQGIIYYQRLRHMTADKWQVRATGAVDMTTHQPIKGRKRGGAIRFGEMERDCLISHGAVYTLKDRLLDCSDNSTEWVCDGCGGMLSPCIQLMGSSRSYDRKQPKCSVCGPEVPVSQINMPYAFKYLVTELASVNIKTQLTLKSADDIIANQPRVAVAKVA